MHGRQENASYLDGAARALEVVELIAGSYGREEPGRKARELRERMEGEDCVQSELKNITFTPLGLTIYNATSFFE